ncbi:hypothetical protein RV134_310114 [Roseovarius sp. EC-HK134]|nr:hypothetical protein RV420_360221 [Roseovarius sp. EC-SD190]VVT19629.1 hypothetical protein RV134_310114 [Roseovarius sp. EC-HK134]
MVEQLTFNQWVAGSNPARLTTTQKMGVRNPMRCAVQRACNSAEWPRAATVKSPPSRGFWAYRLNLGRRSAPRPISPP